MWLLSDHKQWPLRDNKSTKVLPTLFELFSLAVDDGCDGEGNFGWGAENLKLFFVISAVFVTLSIDKDYMEKTKHYP